MGDRSQTIARPCYSRGRQAVGAAAEHSRVNACAARARNPAQSRSNAAAGNDDALSQEFLNGVAGIVRRGPSARVVEGRNVVATSLALLMGQGV